MRTQSIRIPLEETLECAHKTHLKSMNAYAYFKLHDHEVGQDLVQETFVKAWSYMVKGGRVDFIKPFLYHVLNQLIIDEYRKQRTTSLDALIKEGGEPWVDYTEEIIGSSSYKEAMGFVCSLPAKYQEIIRMRYKDGLSIKEISAATGQTKNAVAVQMFRGITKLKNLYNHT